jgi:hypothetical protein
MNAEKRGSFAVLSGTILGQALRLRSGRLKYGKVNLTLPNLRIFFCEECFYRGFGFLIVAFTDVLVTDISALVDQVQRWPVTIIISAPGSPVIILATG